MPRPAELYQCAFESRPHRTSPDAPIDPRHRRRARGPRAAADPGSESRVPLGAHAARARLLPLRSLGRQVKHAAPRLERWVWGMKQVRRCLAQCRLRKLAIHSQSAPQSQAAGPPRSPEQARKRLPAARWCLWCRATPPVADIEIAVARIALMLALALGRWTQDTPAAPRISRQEVVARGAGGTRYLEPGNSESLPRIRASSPRSATSLGSQRWSKDAPSPLPTEGARVQQDMPFQARFA